jgi:hypothetical protein
MAIQQTSPTFQQLHCLAKYLLDNSGFLVEEASVITNSSLDDLVDAIMGMASALRLYYARVDAYTPLLMGLARVAPRAPRLGNLSATSAHDLAIRLATMLVGDVYRCAELEPFEGEQEPGRERGAISKNFPVVLPDWPSGCEVSWLEAQVDWEFARVAEHEQRKERGVVRRPREEGPIVFSSDFRSCRWGTEQFTFTTQQAACVQVLWESRRRGTPDVSQITVLEEAGSAMAGSRKPRLRDLFRKHAAWGTMIVQGHARGTCRVADPPA